MNTESEPNHTVKYYIDIVFKKSNIIFFLIFIAAAEILAVSVYGLMPTYFSSKVYILASNSALPTEAIVAKGNNKDVVVRLAQARLKLARIKSELNSKKSVEFPTDLVASNEVEIIQGRSSEIALFEERKRALDAIIYSLDQERSFAARRVESLKEQVRLAGVQQDVTDREVGVLRNLVEKGLAQAPRLADLQRTAAYMGSRKVETEAQLHSVEQSISQIEQKIISTKGKYKNDLLEDEQKTRESISTLEKQVSSSLEVILNSGKDAKIDSGVLANFMDEILSDDQMLVVYQSLLKDISFDFSKVFGPAFANENNIPPSVFISALQDATTCTRLAPGSKIEIKFRSLDRNLSRVVANTIAQEYALRGKRASQNIDEINRSSVTVIRYGNLARKPDGPGWLIVSLCGIFVGIALGAVFIQLNYSFRRGHVNL